MKGQARHWVVGAVLAMTFQLSAGIAVDSTVPKSFAAGAGEFRYRWHEPAKVEAGKKYPLVVLLHGAGERGTNNVAQLVWGGDLIFQWFKDKGEEFYFVAGQVPGNRRWVEVNWAENSHAMPAEMSVPMTGLVALMEDLFKSDLPIDRDRVYATGVSMGGYGTWDLISRKTEWFAGAMPICGGGDVAQAAKLRELPIWIHHGDADGAVPVWRSRSMYAALLKAGSATTRYTEYPGCGHASWNPAYNNRQTLDWLFSQKRPAAWTNLAESGETISLESVPSAYELSFAFQSSDGKSHSAIFHRGPGFPFAVVDGEVVPNPPFAAKPSKDKLTLRAQSKSEKLTFSNLRIRPLSL